MSDHGVTGTRGSDGCGMFHEYAPGPDKFCDCCRPSPDVVKPIEDWWKKQKKAVPTRGTADWRTMLEEWVAAGRPGEEEVKKIRAGKQGR